MLKYMHERKEAATKAEWDEAVDEALEKVLEEEWPKWVSEVRSMGLSCLAGNLCFCKGAITTKFSTLLSITICL